MCIWMSNSDYINVMPAKTPKFNVLRIRKRVWPNVQHSNVIDEKQAGVGIAP